MSQLITDNGREFSNDLNTSLCQALQINRKFTSSIHPQTNAAAESFNKWIIRYMKSFLSDAKDDWESLIVPMLIAYNTAVHDSTRKTPFFLTFGRDPNDLVFPLKSDYQSQWVNDTSVELNKAHEQAKENMENTRNTMILSQKSTNNIAFNVGEKVLIFYPKSTFTGKGGNAKFVPNWLPCTCLLYTSPSPRDS